MCIRDRSTSIVVNTSAYTFKSSAKKFAVTNIGPRISASSLIGWRQYQFLPSAEAAWAENLYSDVKHCLLTKCKRLKTSKYLCLALLKVLIFRASISQSVDLQVFPKLSKFPTCSQQSRCPVLAVAKESVRLRVLHTRRFYQKFKRMQAMATKSSLSAL